MDPLETELWVLGIEPVSTARAKCALNPRIYTELFISFCVSACMCVCVGTHATVCEWRSEANFMEVILTSHFYGGLGDQIQVAGLWAKSLHPLNHLSRLTGRF